MDSYRGVHPLFYGSFDGRRRSWPCFPTWVAVSLEKMVAWCRKSGGVPLEKWSQCATIPLERAFQPINPLLSKSFFVCRFWCTFAVSTEKKYSSGEGVVKVVTCVKMAKHLTLPFNHKTIRKIMKKIFIKNETTVMDILRKGLKVEGRLWLEDTDDGELVIWFQKYDRKPSHLYRDRLIHRLEHGWVRESVERIKVFESIPKDLGTSRVLSVMDREHKSAKDALIERELDLLEFC